VLLPAAQARVAGDNPTLFVMPALPLPRAAGAGGKPSLPLPPAAAGNILQDETRRQKECVDACAKLCAGKHGCSITHACRLPSSTLAARGADIRWGSLSRARCAP